MEWITPVMASTSVTPAGAVFAVVVFEVALFFYLVAAIIASVVVYP